MKTKQTDKQEFMSIGQLAKKMDLSVRTLQYYDQEHVLSPSSESSGGRRLYTYKDMIRLHQILSLKSLGFSLRDIKDKLIPLDTPQEVEQVLMQQALAIQESITKLTKELSSIEALREEVMQMQVVDFKKYADIITNLHMNNQYYRLIKYIDEDTLDHIRNQFDKESGNDFMQRLNQLEQHVLGLYDKQVPPLDKRMVALAKQFWDMIMDFTKEDPNILSNLLALGDNADMETHWVHHLLPALECYLQEEGIQVEVTHDICN